MHWGSQLWYRVNEYQYYLLFSMRHIPKHVLVGVLVTVLVGSVILAAHTMSFFNKVLASELQGTITQGGTPVGAGIKLIREVTWAWNDARWTDEIVTDAQGNFRFPETTASNLLSAVVPHEPVIYIAVYLVPRDSEKVLAYTYTKHNYDAQGEFTNAKRDGDTSDGTWILSCDMQKKPAEHMLPKHMDTYLGVCDVLYVPVDGSIVKVNTPAAERVGQDGNNGASTPAPSQQVKEPSPKVSPSTPPDVVGSVILARYCPTREGGESVLVLRNSEGAIGGYIVRQQVMDSPLTYLNALGESLVTFYVFASDEEKAKAEPIVRDIMARYPLQTPLVCPSVAPLTASSSSETTLR
jgi:hypothetical protein